MAKTQKAGAKAPIDEYLNKPPPENGKVAAVARDGLAIDPQQAVKQIKEDSPRLLREIALAKPFDPAEVKWKPGMVKNDRCLAMCYIDARLVMDRLDDVCGVDGWSDDYTILSDGSVMCHLTIFIFAAGQDVLRVTKTDVGNPSEQPDKGDRLKAAFSDALKRAAVKFGIGRYLYRLKPEWVGYDPVKKFIPRPPRLPDFAIPKATVAEERPGYTDPDEELAAVATAVETAPPWKGDTLPNRPSEPEPPRATQVAQPTPERKGERERPVATAATQEKPSANRRPVTPQQPTEEGEKQVAEQNAIAYHLKDWDKRLASIRTPDQLNKVLSTATPNLPVFAKGPVWKAIQANAKGRGWLYDGEAKEFFEPDDSPGDAATPGGLF